MGMFDVRRHNVQTAIAIAFHQKIFHHANMLMGLKQHGQ